MADKLSRAVVGERMRRDTGCLPAVASLGTFQDIARLLQERSGSLACWLHEAFIVPMMRALHMTTME
ncbi:hypothetical protein ASE82_18680 [Sphingomonas sp. Leaf230]|nr:hypothetical protein ASE82_18680 [Sphingomonas sp. Leaf230]